MTAGNRTKFYGTLDELVAILGQIGFEISDVQHTTGRGNQKQICISNGAFVNWWETTGTLVVHGRPEPRDIVEKRLFRHVHTYHGHIGWPHGSGSSEKYDVFICHASEDKKDVARPLAAALVLKGFSVWYDEYELRLGDSLRRSIERGIANSTYGLVVLSPNFFAKEWPKRELDGLTSIEISSGKTILPIWHKVSLDDVRLFSPVLADKVAVDTKRGIPYLVNEIVKAIWHERRKVMST